ncbi:MAG: D-glycero-beta-D-manno-heptose 1-phosphate adenylyltransferase [Limnochordaceae bacterium]|nr:D-glycero-beta-D-manno-heptose 1-phosphate adenylyltransferase [Limnochordaceae bacterium]
MEQAVAFAREIRRGGGRVALTNGCFDLLHAGHVTVLEKARALADALIVGVNTDESVRRLKGAGRPIVPQDERARLVAALRAVDRVVLFGEPTASTLVLAIRPDVYVKGADYTPEGLPEREALREAGARLVLVPLEAGRSTTALIERIRAGSEPPA